MRNLGKRKLLRSLAWTALLCFMTPAPADVAIDAQHHVISHENLGSYYRTTLAVALHNAGIASFSNLRLESNDPLFMLTDGAQNSVAVQQLTAGATVVVELTLSGPLPVDQLPVDAPLRFTATVDGGGGSPENFSVLSTTGSR